MTGATIPLDGGLGRVDAPRSTSRAPPLLPAPRRRRQPRADARPLRARAGSAARRGPRGAASAARGQRRRMPLPTPAQSTGAAFRHVAGGRAHARSSRDEGSGAFPRPVGTDDVQRQHRLWWEFQGTSYGVGGRRAPARSSRRWRSRGGARGRPSRHAAQPAVGRNLGGRGRRRARPDRRPGRLDALVRRLPQQRAERPAVQGYQRTRYWSCGNVPIMVR